MISNINYSTCELPKIQDMYCMVKEGSENYKRKIKNPVDAFIILDSLKGYDQMREHLFVVSLDTKNQIIACDVVSVGNLNSNLVHPREVFYTAITHRAASIILAHNHPSGDPTPSKEDILVTEKLMEGGKILGIDVLDHIICGVDTSRYVSMKDEGLIR